MFKLDRVPARLIGGAAIAAIVVGTGVGADAATKHKKKRVIIRTVTMTYQGGCGITAGAQATPGTCVIGASYDLALKPGEKFVSVSVADDNLPAVPAILWLGTGVNAPNQQFCTSIKNFPASGTQPSLDLFDGVDPTCPGSATTGTIKVTFSSVPIK
ncbi:MAG TPA: hypothetical protein VFJ98_01905 [Mycobacteriales bacterium]|nr:hypothetical protein [Mycobacteriales bacterium]